MVVFSWTLALVLSLALTAYCASGLITAPPVIIMYSLGVTLGVILSSASIATLIISMKW